MGSVRERGRGGRGALVVAAGQVVLYARLAVVHDDGADGAHVLRRRPPRAAAAHRLGLAARFLCLQAIHRPVSALRFAARHATGRAARAPLVPFPARLCGDAGGPRPPL